MRLRRGVNTLSMVETKITEINLLTRKLIIFIITYILGKVRSTTTGKINALKKYILLKMCSSFSKLGNINY